MPESICSQTLDFTQAEIILRIVDSNFLTTYIGFATIAFGIIGIIGIIVTIFITSSATNHRIDDFRFEVNNRFEKLELRMDRLEIRMDRLEEISRIHSQNFSKIDSNFTNIEMRFGNIETRFANIETDINELKTDSRYMRQRLDYISDSLNLRKPISRKK